MKNWKLCVIIDKKLLGDGNLKELARNIVEGGADMIQLRDKVSSDDIFYKDALLLRDITDRSDAAFIVNDRADIAAAVDADGVHLGQKDLPPAKARGVLGESKLIGVSCHSVREAVRAREEGADYIGLGAAFKTSTKPDSRIMDLGLIERVQKAIELPVICVGGINSDNLEILKSYGAENVAVSSVVILSSDPTNVTRKIKNILENVHDAVGICKK